MFLFLRRIMGGALNSREFRIKNKKKYLLLL